MASEYRLRYHYDVPGTHFQVVLHASLLQEVLDPYRNLHLLAVDHADHARAVPAGELVEPSHLDHHVEQRHVALEGQRARVLGRADDLDLIGHRALEIHHDHVDLGRAD